MAVSWAVKKFWILCNPLCQPSLIPIPFGIGVESLHLQFILPVFPPTSLSSRSDTPVLGLFWTVLWKVSLFRTLKFSFPSTTHLLRSYVSFLLILWDFHAIYNVFWLYSFSLLPVTPPRQLPSHPHLLHALRKPNLCSPHTHRYRTIHRSMVSLMVDTGLKKTDSSSLGSNLPSKAPHSGCGLEHPAPC